MKRRTLLVSAVTLSLGAAAADTRTITYNDTHFSIDLAAGYAGPVEHVSGTSVSRGFRKPYPGTPLSTVILVTVRELGPSFAKQAPGERARLTRETLEAIVAGIENNRVGFRSFEPRTVTIAGYSGLKLAWSGAAQGIAFDGVVYCVLVGSRAIAVQIQDPAGRGKERIAEAVRAVERMRIAR
ncbi:MAG: hypothetical protein GEV05_14280 [Betaproteobacteria bacterium]|nr:hypothetical protein [Betaproteobacteria bacterium]